MKKTIIYLLFTIFISVLNANETIMQTLKENALVKIEKNDIKTVKKMESVLKNNIQDEIIIEEIKRLNNTDIMAKIKVAKKNSNNTTQIITQYITFLDNLEHFIVNTPYNSKTFKKEYIKQYIRDDFYETAKRFSVGLDQEYIIFYTPETIGKIKNITDLFDPDNTLYFIEVPNYKESKYSYNVTKLLIHLKDRYKHIFEQMITTQFYNDYTNVKELIDFINSTYKTNINIGILESQEIVLKMYQNLILSTRNSITQYPTIFKNKLKLED